MFPPLNGRPSGGNPPTDQLTCLSVAVVEESLQKSIVFVRFLHNKFKINPSSLIQSFILFLPLLEGTMFRIFVLGHMAEKYKKLGMSFDQSGKGEESVVEEVEGEGDKAMKRVVVSDISSKKKFLSSGPNFVLKLFLYFFL